MIEPRFINGRILGGDTLAANQPFDLVYDGLGTGNQFVGNACTTSSPSGLCAP